MRRNMLLLATKKGLYIVCVNKEFAVLHNNDKACKSEAYVYNYSVLLRKSER